MWRVPNVFKGMDEKVGSFEGYDELNVLGFIGCGGWPGPVAPLHMFAKSGQRLRNTFHWYMC